MARSKVLNPVSKGVYLVVAAAMVLSLVAVALVPQETAKAAPATYNVVPYTLAKAGSGTAQWSTADKHTGSSSVKLTTSIAGDYAGFGMASSGTINSITSLSFWYKDISYNNASGPRISLQLNKLGNNYLAVSACAVSSTLGWKKANAITGVKTTDWITPGVLNQIWWYGTCNPDGTGYVQIGGPISFSSLKALPLITGANVLGVAVYMGVVGPGLGAGSAYVDDLEVKGVTYYGSIQDACSSASYAGIVNVAAGTYDEQVVIDRAITLQGAGDTTIVKPSSADKLTQVFGGLFSSGTPDTKQVAGIIVANAITPTGVTVKNLKVDSSLVTTKPTGADYLAGIFYRETGGVIDTVSVVGGGAWCSGDRAFGIYLSATTNTSSVEVKGSTITNFDKNGIEAMGKNLSVNIHHNTITGRGPTLVGDEVQNGVDIGRDAVGTVNYNTISNLEYGPKTWWAAGILVYHSVSPTGKSATANNNTITNCQIGIMFKNANATAQDNIVSGGTVGLAGIHAQPNYAGAYTASFVHNTVSGITDYSAIDAETYATLTPGTGATLTATISNNTLTGGYGLADGVYIGGGAGSVTATISGNTISGWPEHGINLGDARVAGATITGNTITNNAMSGLYIAAAVNAANVGVHFNNIEGNEEYGIYNGDTTHTLNAEHNWWGDPAGPSHSAGAGDAVSDDVDYSPWLDAPYPGGVDRSYNVVRFMSLPALLTTTNMGDYDAIGTPYSGALNDITSLSFRYRHVDYDDYCGPRMSLALSEGGDDYLAVSGCAVDSAVWKTADAISGVRDTDWYTTGTGNQIWWYGTWDGTDPESYIQVGGPISFTALKTALTGADVLAVAVYMGVVDGVGPGSAYVDDLEVNGTTYGIPEATFESIQEAIDDDDTWDGDTLEVLPGKYVESLDVYKQLTIRSTAGAEETIIDVLLAYGIDIWHDDVTIQGFTITGFEEGIILDADWCTISQNIITDNEYGIIIEGDLNTIAHNVMANNWCGIYIEGGDNNTISYNTIEDNWEGIYIYGGSDNAIEYNDIRNNVYDGGPCGIDVEDGAGSGNYAHYNNIEGNEPYGVYNDPTNPVFDATLNWWGDATGPSHPPAIGNGDAVSDNVDYSPWLDAPWPDGVDRDYNVINLDSGYWFDTIQDAIDDSETLDGDILEVLPGKYVEYLEVDKELTIRSREGAEVTIIDDTYSTGITITADYVTIQGFTITLFETGILLDGADECTITENIIEYNGVGIAIDEGEDNAIVYNTIRHNEEWFCGIHVYDASGNYANYNNIEGNSPDGVYNPTVNWFDAKYNWWGDPTGPYNWTTNPSATGDAVSDYVDYTPWLNGPYPVGGERWYNVDNLYWLSYNSIQDAIDNAIPGDILEVLPGKYHESLDVWVDDLTIRSVSGAEQTVIDALDGDGIYIEANGVKIQGFTICNFAGDGIHVAANGCTISSNIIKNNWCGIYTDGSGNTIENNTISGNHQDWGAMTNSSTSDLNGVWGSGSNDVFAVGDGGTILHYGVSGWSAMSSGTTSDLNGVWGRDWDDVYAVGDGGTILHYDGISWSPMDSGSSEDLNGVSGFWGGPYYGVFAVGDGGTILCYDGISWIPVDSDTSEDLNGVSYILWDDFVAVGDEGTILGWEDYWGPWGSGVVTNDLNGAWGIWYYVIVVVGDDGTILYWDSDSWEPMDSGTTSDLNGIWGNIWDGGEIFIVGEGGTILYYDGSDDWEPMASGTTSNLNGVWGSDWNDVFAVGDGGTILHYNGSDSGGLTGGICLTEAGDTNTIRWNTIMDNDYGIYIGGGDSNAMEYNIIRNNDVMVDSGVHVAASSSGNSLHWNKIEGNGPVGVYNDPTNPLLNATQNWWGHHTGPYNATSNSKGLGNAVSNNVTYRPWLIGDYEDLFRGTRLYITSDKRFRFTGPGYDSGIVSDSSMVVRGDGRVDINYRRRDGNGYSIVFSCRSNSVGDSCLGTLSGQIPVMKVFTIYDPVGVE